MEQTMEKGKIYIAGMMNDSRSFAEYADAEKSLTAEGYEPVNPFAVGSVYGLDRKGRILQSFQLLTECTGVYMLDGWQTSKELRILFKMAEEMDKEIMFHSSKELERYVGKKRSIYVDTVKSAIREVFGSDFDLYETKTKERNVFYMRMIFTYHCRAIGMTLKQIKTYTHRDHTTMLHYLKRYKDEYKYNAEFRESADRIAGIMANYKQSVEAEI